MERWKELQKGLSIEDFLFIRRLGMLEQIDFILNYLGWRDEDIKKSELIDYLERERRILSVELKR